MEIADESACREISGELCATYIQGNVASVPSAVEEFAVQTKSPYLFAVLVVGLLGATSSTSAFTSVSTGTNCVVDRWSPTTFTGAYGPGMLANESTSESSDMDLVCGVTYRQEAHDSTAGGWGTEVDPSDDVLLRASISDNSADESVVTRAHACSFTYTSCAFGSTSNSMAGASGVQDMLVQSYWYLGVRKLISVLVTLPDNDGNPSKILGIYSYYRP